MLLALLHFLLYTQVNHYRYPFYSLIPSLSREGGGTGGRGPEREGRARGTGPREWGRGHEKGGGATRREEGPGV